ncbi:serine carboxypeptidase-like 51 [Tripterygium wilfordii]|uniref:serine carboxypeptidase-like 51 n=1 Tax=Tripterygium wilfordii TaxID=458696 RepID=UPI0018F7EE65|nr:serine carboxypeptidase-like 51 [Tripterygium wilfordii]
MEKHHVLLLFLLFSFLLFHLIVAMESEDRTEEWGYVEVREKAHMFWWHYKSPHRVEDASKPWPIILWLSGGPGTSGTAFGNFYQVGPRGENLLSRESTWVRKADLLFVDSPVGTGFSYVVGELRVARSDEQIAIDLLALLKNLFDTNQALQKSPLFIFGESYAGKTAAILGLQILKSIEENKLKLRLGGVALGCSWISPLDSVLTWGPLLKDMSWLDDAGLEEANRWASKIQNQLENHNAMDATGTWSALQDAILDNSNSVDLHNFLFDHQRRANTQAENPVDFKKLMNGVVKSRLKIIPEDVDWGGQQDLIFKALRGDFMNPKIKEVGELLAKGVNVTIYNGQLDIICSTKGAESWVKKLIWDGLETFLKTSRVPLYHGNDRETKGFKRSHRHLTFYWILRAGHVIPKDQPWITLQMVGEITESPRLDTEKEDMIVLR